MFLVGILIHLTFLFSIFDIYFKSPIVNNIVPYKPEHDSVADRLVLFVVDGLRAESFVNYSTMPYLRSVANSNGRWGISNTQVPTESRPGHVAVIAGFYEDPSAIAKGWKENAVDFDSVFNQSAHTWCWGTYDIVNIFTKSNIGNNIVVHEFDPYDQSFSTDKNTTLLDAWVFDNVKLFFQNAKGDVTLREQLKKDKIVLFLHLLGTDTAGHTHKPKTQNFLATLQHVDAGIQEIEKVIRGYFNDDRTTFLMTSDHGMTDWGSHGAGDDHETQTPYVIWGAGVKQAETQSPDTSTVSMSLAHRLDINQVDLSPLMSTVLSIPVPVNSKGIVNTNLLDMGLSNKAKAIYSNSRQLASQYHRRRLNVEENAISLLYYPYEPFDKEKYDHLIQFTENLLAKEDYEQLIAFSEEIIQLSLSGLQYYHNYYQMPLLVLVTLSFLGWIACLLKLLSQHSFTQENSTTPNLSSSSIFNKLKTFIFGTLCCLAVFLVIGQSLPIQYLLYSLLPIILWWHSLSSLSIWMKGYRHFRRNKTMCLLTVQVFCYSMGSVAMGLSFTYRWMLSIPLLGMGVWPFVSSTRQYLTKPMLVAWPVGCLLLSIFSFMPVIGKSVFIEQVITAGVIWLIAILLYTNYLLLPLFHKRHESKREIILTAIQAVLLVISLYNIYVQSKRFERGTPVSYFYQTLTWLTAGTSLVLPFTSSKRLVCRLSAIYTAIINFYLLLSVSHEGLFIVVLTFNLICWIIIEFKQLNLKQAKIIEDSFEKENKKMKSLLSIERVISSQDFRRAFFFMLYIIVAFFGTGNIASLNSFEVRWVTCFITSFQPFVITGLILLKTLAPFLSVACSFRTVQHITNAPTGYLIIIVLIYSNIMGIQLLYKVRNTGSWLDIGTSISQFVIVQVITLFIVLINQLARLLTDLSIVNFADRIFTLKKIV